MPARSRFPAARGRAQLQGGPVMEDDGETQNMVLRRAVTKGVRARGVRPDVSADRAEVPAGRIRTEPQPLPAGRLLHAAVERARLDTHEAPLPVQRQDPVHVRGKIEDDPRTQGLPGEAGSPAAGGHGDY